MQKNKTKVVEFSKLFPDLINEKVKRTWLRNPDEKDTSLYFTNPINDFLENGFIANYCLSEEEKEEELILKHKQ